MINQTTSISVVFFKIYFIISYQSKSLSVTPPFTMYAVVLTQKRSLDSLDLK